MRRCQTVIRCGELNYTRPAKVDAAAVSCRGNGDPYTQDTGFDSSRQHQVPVDEHLEALATGPGRNDVRTQ
ncbi:MAG: hypothetical protein M3O89_03245, partial [Actinomycetota bacterium]|nr:hypothetical protein [Actinomycetota bacterium]